MRWQTICILPVLVAASCFTVAAQDIFDEDFESYLSPSVVTNSGPTADYNVLFSANSGPQDFKAIFGFDYSTVKFPLSIPSAPHSAGGSTKGLFLTVNKDALGSVAAVNLYPFMGFSSGDVSLLFDLWINVDASANSTEHALFGINHSGALTNQIGKAGSDGLFFAMDGDGGVAATSTTLRDYSVFQGEGSAAPQLMTTSNTVFGPAPLLGNRFDNTDAGFTNSFPSRTIAGFGNTVLGAAGLQWLSVEVRQQTNLITWLLNGTIVGQYTNTNFYTTGYIMLGYNDAFASIGDSNMFAVFDNIRMADPNTIKSWTGQVDTNWFNPSNWSPPGVPGSNDTIYLTSGTLGFSSPVTFYGHFNWYGGTISGSSLTIASNGVLNIGGSGIKTLQTVLTNCGTLSWSGNGTLNVANGTCNGTAGAIENTTNGFINILGDGVVTNGSACVVTNAYIRNAGTLRKSGGTGTTIVYIPLTNSGTIFLAAGALALITDVVLPSSSTLAFPLSGTNIGSQYGQFQVAGALRFGGMLLASTNYTPRFRDSLRVITCGSHCSGFTAHTLPALTAGNFMEAVADAYGISINAYNTNAPNVPPPTNLLNQIVGIGDTAAFFITPNGVPPFTYQWQSNSVILGGETNSSLVLSNVQLSAAGTYCVLVISYVSVTNLYCATLTVLTPPTFTNQPVALAFTNGSSITLSAGASGSGPFQFQWRINGANIIGATSSAYTITNAQFKDAGNYSVVIGNAVGAIASTNALLSFPSSQGLLADNFASRLTSNSVSGLITGNNATATRESGEPLHAGKQGSNSMWLQWTAPSNGVPTFSTAGSSFDTLLAIYTSTNAFPDVSNLVAAASNDDKDGKYFTSQASLSAKANTNYYIAVDGLAGDTGNIILTWSMSVGVPTLPRISVQPADQTVLRGDTASFSVSVTNVNNSAYQWFYNDALALAAATNSTLDITNVGYANLGYYSVEITGTNGQRAVSRHAALEIGTSGGVSADKLADLEFDQPGDLVGLVGGLRIKAFAAASSVSIGTLGFQDISTYFSTTSSGEPVSGSGSGASRWWQLAAGQSAPVIVDTIGSDYDTVLTIFTGPNTFSLSQVARDDNGAPDGIRSKATFSATSGGYYWIRVDGITTAPGKVNVNWKMGVPPSSVSPSTMFLNETNTPPTLNGGGAGGNPTPTYQWQLNGNNISGATSSTYTLPPLAYNSGGIYSVVVSNLMGIVTNTISYISILSPLRISKETVNYRITGSFTQAMALQTSSNFNTWKSLMTNVDSRVGINYPDSIAPVHTNLFYRLKSP